MGAPIIVDNGPRMVVDESGVFAQRGFQEPALNMNTRDLVVTARCYANKNNVFSHDTIARSQMGDITRIALVDGVGSGESQTITKDRESANALAEKLVSTETIRSEKTEPFAYLELENRKGIGHTLKVQGNKDCTVIVIGRNMKGEYDVTNVRFAYFNPHNEKNSIEEPTEFLEEGSLVMAFTDGGLQAFFSDEVQKGLYDTQKENEIPQREPVLDSVLWGNVENSESLQQLKERIKPMIKALNEIGPEKVTLNIGANFAALPSNTVTDDRGYVFARVK